MSNESASETVRARPEVLPDALDEVGPAGATGVDRALGIRADNLDGAVGDLFEVLARAGDGATGADAGDEMGDLTVGIGPDLGTRCLVMTFGTLRIGVLIGFPGPVDLLDQTVGDAVVRVGVVGCNRGRADDDVGAVGTQYVPLVLADLVRADENALVAALLSDQGQADAGVPGGRFDDGAARLEHAGGLGGVDHLDRDAVLAAAPGIEVFDLRDHPAAALGYDRVQLDQRGVADEFTDVLRDPHAYMVSGRGTSVLAGGLTDVFTDLTQRPRRLRHDGRRQLKVVNLAAPHPNFGRHSCSGQPARGQPGVV